MMKSNMKLEHCRFKQDAPELKLIDGGKKYSVDYYREAQAAEKEGDLETAMKLYSKVEWHFKAVNLALSLGRVSDAITYYVPIRGELLPTADGPFSNGLANTLYLNLTMIGSVVDFRRFHGKVLDVGCRDGRYFSVFKKLGVSVDDLYGVDIDSSSLVDARRSGEIPPSHIYECKVKDMPKKFNGFFDYAVVLNFCIQDPERKESMKRISTMLKPEGKILASFTTLDELKQYSPEINQHFNTKYISFFKSWTSELLSFDESSLDLAAHRFLMHGTKK